MSDELERRISGLTPRGAPADLRARILRAVADEIARESPPPRRRRGVAAGPAVAAALILAAGLYHRAVRDSDARLERAFGPPPSSPRAVAIARDVAEVAGPEAGRWAFDRLNGPTPGVGPDLARHAAEVRRLARESTLEPPEHGHEATHPHVPQALRDRLRPRPGRVPALERVVHVGHRPTA